LPKILAAISPNLSDRCDDRNSVKEKHGEHEYNRYGETHDAEPWRQAKVKRTPAKRAKSAKKAAWTEEAGRGTHPPDSRAAAPT
jgi:hypothetical protein